MPLDTAVTTTAARRQQLTANLTALEARLRDIPAAEVLRQQLTELEAEISAADAERGKTEELLRQDDERRLATRLIAEQLERSTRELDRWGRLNDLIGQADGVKFSRFAQALTLQRLVEVGNHHLHRINPRYRMRHRRPSRQEDEQLELEIIDMDMGDNVRPMTTLSGGETFLVSLALALGLSELASGRTNIQSLFIDEGFGTLDERILDRAISALEMVHDVGAKKIGLISHVKELRERIGTQVVVQPVGNGVSQIDVVG